MTTGCVRPRPRGAAPVLAVTACTYAGPMPDSSRPDPSGPAKVAPPRWLKVVNPLLLLARRLRLGAARELPVLVLVGRRTGKVRRTPVSVLQLDGHRYLLSGFPGTDWAANARAAGVGVLAVGRREEQVRLVELSPTDAVPVLRAWPVRIPQGAKIMKDAGVVADLEPDTFAALAGRCAAFRIEPV